MRFLIIDDHPLFRTALSVIVCQLASDVEVVEANNLDEAFEVLEQEGKTFDLLILDLALGHVDSTESIPAIQDMRPDVPVVVVSNYEDVARSTRVLELGARGYIPKSMPAEMILGALRLILAGGLYAPPSIFRSAIYGEEPVRPNQTAGADLTDHQLEVLRELSHGGANNDISKALAMPLGTVKSNIQGILQTLGAKNRTDAVVIALRAGILLFSTEDQRESEGGQYR